MNRPVILIFIVAAIALLPMCCVFTGFLGGSNFMAWRVMESIDPKLGSDAQKIKSEMSEFLDMHSKETYDEENKEGCVRTWEQLFRLEFCEYDLSDYPIADLGPGDGEGYCPAAGCPIAKTIYDCNSLEDQYGSVPFEVDCLDGVLIDSNGNGEHDSEDKAKMTTCHPYWDSVGACCCAYSGSHAGWDQATGDGRMGQAIFTPVSGAVVDVGMTSTGWGYRVTIYNCGMLYTFNHLLPSKMTSSPPVKVGDHVHAGDVVGWMGGGTGIRRMTAIHPEHTWITPHICVIWATSIRENTGGELAAYLSTALHMDSEIRIIPTTIQKTHAVPEEPHHVRNFTRAVRDLI